MKFFKKRKTIVRDKGTVLLYRWNIFECRFFSIKIHKLVGSDHACQHDHPWAFITFLLKGGYVEYTPLGGQGHGVPFLRDSTGHVTSKAYEVSKVHSRFSLLYRPAHYLHRLEIHQPVWTLVLTFKKKREWGFSTPRGWVSWKKYRPTSNNCE